MNEWMDAEGHVERAHKFFEDGRWAEAEGALREAIAINPYRAEWHFNLGLTLEAAGRFDDAVKAFTDCHQLQEDDPAVPPMIGANLLRAGKPKEAITWLEKAEKLAPQEATSFVHRIEAYSRLGDHEQAEVMFYMAQQCDPKNPDAYALLADSLLARGMHEKAVWCLREAANLDPNMPGVHARLAEAYAATGRQERARQLYLRELRNNPGDIDSLLDLGCLLVQMNRIGEAGEKFRRVLEMESDNPDAHFYLAELADRQGSSSSAIEQYDVVLRLDPQFGAARRRAAVLRLRRRAPGDEQAAHDLIEQELEEYAHAPDRFAPADLAELGRLLLDAQQPDQARRVLHRLSVATPEDPESQHLYAAALLETGDRAAGIEACRRVLKLNPKHVAAMHNLAIASVHERHWAKARYWVSQALLVDPDDGALRHLRLKLRLHTIAELLDWLTGPLRGVFSRRRRAT